MSGVRADPQSQTVPPLQMPDQICVSVDTLQRTAIVVYLAVTAAVLLYYGLRVLFQWLYAKYRHCRYGEEEEEEEEEQHAEEETGVIPVAATAATTTKVKWRRAKN
jgi:hypothetical protein